ncbi:MAG: bifunctional 3-deoxy-7-phosphoheptulonate synthase/chorismate mutase type II [Candidatus Amulumruptor caecigallinarius]|nr:bifunctional 3-deoxy-7-phosphoheptulonate synthase/chorismate mutase type II [Candidatus Amulumruptor caecigallinarius]MCM1396839.1 bifunctional 3-deoxy-7-phosphoheptulonate synthase/chorismate mutase type II [Candidatus Amulumruptor caecigallinarius]MCM1454217.1 bifunctional 3-deoxy-7-phosphoheptulonate synthase/chorismate mutase type II [bacterium]
MKDLKPIVDGVKPLIIAGPCSAETEKQVMDTATQLAANGIKVFRAGIWKPRTKPGGFEGVGKEGLAWLRRVKDELGMLVSTEVATRQHVIEALDAGIDLLWIGARTSANPFAMQEIADTLAEAQVPDMPVLVKNPVNPDLELWIGALQRIYNAGIRRLGAIHRGFSVYGKHLYRNMPQWHIPIELRLRYPNLPIICDPSHIGGKRELIAPLSQQSMNMGFDGLIIESHCDPDCAWSDAAQQVTPDTLQLILDTLVTPTTQQTTESLAALRQQIDRIDNDLLEILSKRMRVSREIGQYKKEHSMPVVQPGRYNDIMATRVKAGTDMGIGADAMRTILLAIHEESVRQQLEILNNNRANA